MYRLLHAVGAVYLHNFVFCRFHKVMSFLLDRRLLPVQYTCWLCSNRPGEIAFTSRNAFRSHLIFVHQSDITRRHFVGNQYEDVIAECNPIELAAKLCKFQLRAATLSERRALYSLEQRGQSINIMPCYIPSLYTQVLVPSQSGGEGEGVGDKAKQLQLSQVLDDKVDNQTERRCRIHLKFWLNQQVKQWKLIRRLPNCCRTVIS